MSCAGENMGRVGEALREDDSCLTRGRAGQAMACLNNLILGILLSKVKYRTTPSARRYFSVHPA